MSGDFGQDFIATARNGQGPRMPKDFPDNDALLTPREVAQIFGVRTTTIARWARERTLTSLRTPGGHRRYRREDIQRLLDEDRREAGNAPVTAGQSR